MENGSFYVCLDVPKAQGYKEFITLISNWVLKWIFKKDQATLKSSVK